MPLYNDLGFYYTPHMATPSYFSSPFLGTSGRTPGSSRGLGLMPIPRLLPSRVTPGYIPPMPIIHESFATVRRQLPSLDRSTSPRALPRYVPPKPVHINTSEIDVSVARYARDRRERAERPEVALGGEPDRQATIKRGRTVVRLHTKKFKENPTLDADGKRRLTPGEKLVQKFLILDKAEEEAKAARRKRLEELEERERVEAEIARLHALAAKKAATDAEAESAPVDGTFELDQDASAHNFPTIQGLTENAALDILLSVSEGDEEKVKGGELTRDGSTGTVKKRKTKEKSSAAKTTKKKNKKKDIDVSQSEDSSATGDEMLEKCTLQRRNTIRFRRNSSDVEAFPEIDSIPGSRRSSFDLISNSRRSSFDQIAESRRSSVDQTPGSRRSSMDSTGEEIPIASEKKSTVKRRKGPKHKFIADVSVDNGPEARSPKFVVDEVKVEHSPASPRGNPKKFRYEVIVEDVEAERVASRRGKSGRENKSEVSSKKKKAKGAIAKPLADLPDKSPANAGGRRSSNAKEEPKPKTTKSFQKSRPETDKEAKSQAADKKTEGKDAQQKGKGNFTQGEIATHLEKAVIQPPLGDDVQNKTPNKQQDSKVIQLDKGKPIDANLKSQLKDSNIPKDENNIQKTVVPVDKRKPIPSLPKEEESKSGKNTVEKTKAVKRQADPTPIILTPTPEINIKKSDSGINFWDFLNNSEEDIEIKMPVSPKIEPKNTNVVDKNDRLKGTKAKPNLHLKIEKEKDVELVIDTTPAAKNKDKIETPKSGLLANAPEETVPKWKIPLKDRQKAPTTESNETEKSKTEAMKSDAGKGKQETITGANKNKEIDKTMAKPEIEKVSELKSAEEHTSKAVKSDSPPTETLVIPKPQEKTEEKPVPKWKGLDKQLPSPTSSKEMVTSPKTAAAPNAVIGDTKLKSETDRDLPQTKNESDLLSAAATDASEKNTVNVAEKKGKGIAGGLQKEDIKSNITKDADGKGDKVSKVSPSEESKPVPKWKIKTPLDQKDDLKKIPSAQTKQTPADKLCEVKGNTQQDKGNGLLSKPDSPSKEKEKSVGTNEIKLEPESKSSDVEKQPKKQIEKLKISTIQEPSSLVSNRKNEDSAPTTKIASKAEELKKKDVVGKETVLERQVKSGNKVKEEENDVRQVFGENIKSLDRDKGVVNEGKEGDLKKVITVDAQKTVEEGKAVQNEPKSPVKKVATPSELTTKLAKKDAPMPPKEDEKVIAQKGKDDLKCVTTLPEAANSEVTSKEKEKSPVKKKVLKPFGDKNKDGESSEPTSPVKKDAKVLLQKGKNDSEQLPPLASKTDKIDSPKPKEVSSEPPPKQFPKLGTKENKEASNSEPSSPTKKVFKTFGKVGKEEDKKEATSPIVGKTIPKGKDDEKKEPITSIGGKPKGKDDEKKEPVTPIGGKPKGKDDEKKESITSVGKPIPKGKDDEKKELITSIGGKPKGKDDEKKEPVTPIGEKPQQKSKTDAKISPPAPAKKAQKSKIDPAAPKQPDEEATTPAPSPAPSSTPSSTLGSGSDADSEDSSSDSEGDGDATPRASSGGSSSSSGSSCSSSDSGFDSRPSSVPGSPPSNKKDCDVNCHRKCQKLMPHLCGVNQKLIVEALTLLKRVPSTASSEASGASSEASARPLACSPSLDPYSEDAGLLGSHGSATSGRTTPPASSLPRFRKYTVDDFQFLKLLGKGSFGKVLLAELRGTDRYYAVKCLKKDVVLEDDDVECTLIERKVLALGSKHPYLCHLFCTFQTESHLLFVMEYLNGGDLMFHIQQSGRFPESRARFYAAEIVSGLKFLHKKGIVYRDLKLDNILLDYEGHIRIADFGMCKLQIFLDRTADTFCGTPDYMAPEIIKGLKYNQCVDWWSFGVLVFEMLVGVSPFTGCDEDELFWSICNEQPQYPRFLTREAHSLLTSLLEKDALKRLGSPGGAKGDVCDHVFFRAIEWDALERRELHPPFRPRLKHPLDVQYFDAAFTAEKAELTPVDTSILQSMDQAQFQGFSYTNPNTTD